MSPGEERHGRAPQAQDEIPVDEGNTNTGPSANRRERTSLWPFLSALSLGIVAPALVWWANERGNFVAALLLAIALALFLAAVGGWIVEAARRTWTDRE